MKNYLDDAIAMEESFSAVESDVEVFEESINNICRVTNKKDSGSTIGRGIYDEFSEKEMEEFIEGIREGFEERKNGVEYTNVSLLEDSNDIMKSAGLKVRPIGEQDWED